MTGKRILFGALLWITFLCGASAQWRAYPSYYEPMEIEQTSDGMLYVLASGGLFSYNTQDQEVQTYDKTTVLTDCGISHIAWCKAAKKLVIVYSNQNIDLLSPNGDVLNMPAYMNTSMTVDKSVYSVDISGSYAYLSTGFGIVKLNISDGSFTDTYQLGFRVDYSYTDNNYIYAASSTNGLYRASLTSNLLNPNEWTRIGDYVARPKTMDADLLATVNNIKPDGPKYNTFGFLKWYNGKLYSCDRGFDVLHDDNNPGAIQVLNNDNTWTIFQDSLGKQTGIDYRDVMCLDIDPRDENHVMAGAKSGIYEFQNGNFVKLWNNENSPVESFNKQSQDYELIFSVMYDSEGNLWALNSQAPTQSIIEYTKDGQWVSHKHNELMKLKYLFSDPQSLGFMQGLMTDSRGLIWFVNNHWQTPSFYAYQPEQDALISFTEPFVNEDATTLTLTNFQCIAEDKEHNIWIGNKNGLFELEPDQITATSPILNQIKVPRNDGTDYADYLLTGVSITTITIDSNNRKWIGTNGNGIYIIDSDNITTLAHYTTSNSKILSDKILSIAYDNNNNIAYIGTDKGLCSYSSNFSNNSEGMTKNNVWAYPNPVRPGYTGAITITGLTSGATVKIVTSNGTLVNEGTASNGEYKWYGIDLNGKQVASGVYMVEVATSEGDKGIVCKIAVVR